LSNLCIKISFVIDILNFTHFFIKLYLQNIRNPLRRLLLHGWMFPWQWRKILKLIKLLDGCLKCKFLSLLQFVLSFLNLITNWSFMLFCINDIGMLMRFLLLFTVFVTYCTRTSWFRFNKVLSLVYFLLSCVLFRFSWGNMW
jgi:hypothetical protein